MPTPGQYADHVRRSIWSSYMNIKYDYHVIIIQDDHKWWSSRWSYMIIMYDHHIWSSYMMIGYDDHLWQSSMMNLYDDMQWSYIVIRTRCPITKTKTHNTCTKHQTQHNGAQTPDSKHPSGKQCRTHSETKHTKQKHQSERLIAIWQILWFMRFSLKHHHFVT